MEYDEEDDEQDNQNSGDDWGDTTRRKRFTDSRRAFVLEVPLFHLFDVNRGANIPLMAVFAMKPLERAIPVYHAKSIVTTCSNTACVCFCSPPFICRCVSCI